MWLYSQLHYYYYRLLRRTLVRLVILFNIIEVYFLISHTFIRAVGKKNKQRCVIYKLKGFKYE
jgi:hypothetical protein